MTAIDYYHELLGQAMIDMLPDNVLLGIFDFYREDPAFHIRIGFRTWSWRWQALIQVCRRWRCVILGSPRRLDLRVVCTHKTPTRTSLDIWPPFPIRITCQNRVDEKNVENVVAAVEHGHDRISHISMYDINCSALKQLAAAMQQPLPALKVFRLGSRDRSILMLLVLPETFLGGSAPLLEMFELYGIPFPTFPEFISFSTQIRYLSIYDIPHSGYISPNAMVACVAALPNLQRLSIGFQSPLSRPSPITPPPRTRIVFPALIGLSFCGVSEYFEDLVARIDTPVLNELNVTFFMDLIFEIPRLRHFIDRAETLKSLEDQARMEFHDRAIWICVGSPFRFKLEVLCERPDWQLSSIVQVLGQQLPLLSHVEELEIFQHSQGNIEWTDNPDMDTSLWLETFRLFIAVQRIFVPAKLVAPVAAALQELTEGTSMEVLPALNSLFLEGLEPSGPAPEGIQSFVAARQLSDRHVAVRSWNRSY